MNSNKAETVVTRFAPSPTGFLHVGGVRTALYAYLFAKQQNGTFILRIEDTDKAREVAGSIQHIQESLRWLGIEWDYGPDKPSAAFGSCLQSDRLDIYTAYARKLIAKGLAYPDPYSQSEVEQFRQQASAEQRPFLFRNHRPETFTEWDEKTPLRLKVPEIKRYKWNDLVRGELEAGEEMLDDFILIKADGYPTYNFAHVVDDLEMSVTHVMRGEEFISSTPKFLSLYDALEVSRPLFVTLPPIMGPDGKKKLSKRDGAKDLLDYRADGYLADAMTNFLALIGWNPGGEQEVFTKQELIEKFSLERIHKSGGAFNEEKLQWLNKEHVSLLPESVKIDYVTTALPHRDPNTLAKLAPTILERVHNQAEIIEADQAGEYEWAFSDINYPTSLLTWKNDTAPADALPRLRHVAELLATTDFSSTDTIKEAVWEYVEITGKGEVLWPLRVALTGRERSPDPFTCAWVLGSEKTIARIHSACDKIQDNDAT